MEIEDILAPPKRRKGIKSGQKGKRGERKLIKVLEKRFGPNFSRTIGSGNRWGQVANMPQHAQDTFTGDIVCPEGFRIVLESKEGYDDVDLTGCFAKGNATLDEFIEQAEAEAQRTGRTPVVCWKRFRKPWLAMMRTADLPHLNWPYRLVYRDWSMVLLETLLGEPDAFWYEQ